MNKRKNNSDIEKDGWTLDKIENNQDMVVVEGDTAVDLESSGNVSKVNAPKKKTSTIILKICAILASSLLYAIGIDVFISGNNYIPGGVWGIGIMLSEIIPISSSYLVVFLNIPLLILSIVFLGWKFTGYTFLFVGAQAGFSTLIELINIPSYTENALLATIAAAVIMGVGQACCLKVGGCTGGTDIVSVIIQKKKIPLNVPYVIFIVNAIIIAVAFFVYGGITTVILSLLLEFLASKVSDTLLSGLSSAVRFEIVTSKGEAVQHAIVNKLGSGATIVEAKGGYTNEPRQVLICLIHKRQMSTFKRILKEVDPDAFAYISIVTSVLGKGFTDINSLD